MTKNSNVWKVNWTWEIVYWKFNSPTRACNSEVTDPIWPEFEFVWDCMPVLVTSNFDEDPIKNEWGERGGSVVECRTPEREVGGSKPTAAVLCPWARHFTPRKCWLITQEAVAPSRHDWKIVDWDVKPQHKQINTTSSPKGNDRSPESNVPMSNLI